MAEYEEAGFYEIQLNNKQLVFFFMAAVAIAVVVFLCGVMVGRGVRDATLAASGTSIISGPGASRSTQSAVAPADVRQELDFPQRLEADEAESQLEGETAQEAQTAQPAQPGRLARGRRAATRQAESPEASNPETLVASVTTKTEPTQTPDALTETTRPRNQPATEVPAPPKAEASTTAEPTLIGSERGAFTIQVVALKTQEAADSLVNRLREARYRAYVEPGVSAGLYRVRVGRFDSRAEAEQVSAKLRDVEKFKPYITQ
jgi:cell division septation protein DedD